MKLYLDNVRSIVIVSEQVWLFLTEMSSRWQGQYEYLSIPHTTNKTLAYTGSWSL
jgi:hypothetical protein